MSRPTYSPARPARALLARPVRLAARRRPAAVAAAAVPHHRPQQFGDAPPSALQRQLSHELQRQYSQQLPRSYSLEAALPAPAPAEAPLGGLAPQWVDAAAALAGIAVVAVQLADITGELAPPACPAPRAPLP